MTRQGVVNRLPVCAGDGRTDTYSPSRLNGWGTRTRRAVLAFAASVALLSSAGGHAVAQTVQSSQTLLAYNPVTDAVRCARWVRTPAGLWICVARILFWPERVY